MIGHVGVTWGGSFWRVYGRTHPQGEGFLLATAPALAVVWWWSWVSAVLIRHAPPL